MMIGAVQIFLAHTVGVTARRLSYAVEQRQWANPGISRSLAAAPHMLAIALSLFFILANSYGLAVFRQAFLQFVNQPDPSLEQLINDDQATAYVMIGSSLAVEGWIFLFINLGIVGVAIMGAFFSHDPHPDYALVDRLLKRASKTVEQLQINRGKSIAFAEQMVADAGGEDRS
jgi:hypothetical protein